MSIERGITVAFKVTQSISWICLEADAEMECKVIWREGYNNGFLLALKYERPEGGLDGGASGSDEDLMKPLTDQWEILQHRLPIQES